LPLDQGDEDPLVNVDYLISFENLADDFRNICEALSGGNITAI
jgi:hypothetical protein